MEIGLAPSGSTHEAGATMMQRTSPSPLVDERIKSLDETRARHVAVQAREGTGMGARMLGYIRRRTR